MMLTKNFSVEELQCPCCKIANMNPIFMSGLQKIRTLVGRPFIINSGYRCAEHNKSIGGADSSRHLQGLAVDVSIIKWNSSDLHYLVYELSSYTSNDHDYNTGIGIYNSHIHFDFRMEKEALWTSFTR